MKIEQDSHYSVQGRFLKTLSAIILVACLFFVASLSQAYNPLDWFKKMSKPKRRRTISKQTMVAAVRGIEEPSQVDPEARNFQGVDKMDQRNYSEERIARFMAAGNLSLRTSEGKEAAK